MRVRGRYLDNNITNCKLQGGVFEWQITSVALAGRVFQARRHFIHMQRQRSLMRVYITVRCRLTVKSNPSTLPRRSPARAPEASSQVMLHVSESS